MSAPAKYFRLPRGWPISPETEVQQPDGSWLPIHATAILPNDPRWHQTMPVAQEVKWTALGRFNPAIHRPMRAKSEMPTPQNSGYDGDLGRNEM